MAFLKADTNQFGSLVLSVAIAFFPKCAFCWAAYLSVFSAFGIASIPYTPWLKPVMITFFLTNFVTLFLIARKRKNYISFMISVIGAIFIMISSLSNTSPFFAYTGLVLIVASGLWNLLTRKLACKV